MQISETWALAKNADKRDELKIESYRELVGNVVMDPWVQWAIMEVRIGPTVCNGWGMLSCSNHMTLDNQNPLVKSYETRDLSPDQ